MIPDRIDNSLAAKTPIALRGTFGLIMCKLDFRSYSEKPYNFPMFKDLLKFSGCGDGANSMIGDAVVISDVKNDIVANAGTPAGRVIYPTAFVFHESRVGSTLIANMLASDESNLVFSEADVPASLFNSDKKIRRFRETLLLLGRSATHERLFFKFQSIKTWHMHVALEAFPDVPWIYIFRKPVQVLMSHVDPRSIISVGTPPCLRSRGNSRVLNGLKPYFAKGEIATDTAVCAAHLASLCNTALSAYEQFGHYNSEAIANIERDDIDGIKFKLTRTSSPRNISMPRGFFIDYDALPGIVPRVLVSLMGVDLTHHWLQRMREVSTEYSKSKSYDNIYKISFSKTKRIIFKTFSLFL